MENMAHAEKQDEIRESQFGMPVRGGVDPACRATKAGARRVSSAGDQAQQQASHNRRHPSSQVRKNRWAGPRRAIGLERSYPVVDIHYINGMRPSKHMFLKEPEPDDDGVSQAVPVALPAPVALRAPLT